MLVFYIFIFASSCLVLAWAASRLVEALTKVAKYLGWREFVVAFLMMAFASSIPNLFVGIGAALYKIPQLSLGDVVGGNVVDLTLTVALAVLIGKTILPAPSRMVQTSSIFTAVIAILPLVLMLDGTLGRGDGLVLLLAFIFYAFWLFSKKERFKKIYNNHNKEEKIVQKHKNFLKELVNTVLSLGLLVLAAEGIVKSSVYFFKTTGFSIPLLGLLIVGLGNCLPEIYFSIASARKGQNWLVLGNLMGSIIVPATLVLGIVCLISPIHIQDFSLFVIARVFLVISAIFFLLMVRTGQKITKREGVFLLFIYIAFVVAEILAK